MGFIHETVKGSLEKWPGPYGEYARGDER
jgi:hypothetical protein